MHAREELRHVPLHPDDLGQRIAGVDGAARLLVEAAAERLVSLHLLDDVRAAAVGPGLHVRQRLIRFIESDKAVHDRAQRDALEDAVLVAQLRRRLRDDLLHRLEDLERILLGPVRMRREQRVERLRSAYVVSMDVIGNRPDTRRAEIDADPDSFLRILNHIYHSCFPKMKLLFHLTRQIVAHSAQDCNSHFKIFL